MSEDFNEPLLTADETDALLEAMRSDVDTPDVEGADLGSPDRPLRQALTLADRVTQDLSPEIRKMLLRMAKCTALSEEQPAEIIPFNVLTNALLPGSAIGTLRAKDESLGLIIIGPSLAAFIIDRRLGAAALEHDEPTAAPARTELSNIDRRILFPCLHDICAEMSRLWSGSPTMIQLTQVLKTAADLPPFTQFEPLLRIGVRVVPAGGIGDDIVIALTAGAVRAATRIDARPKVLPSADDRSRLTANITKAEVSVIAVLGTARSSIRELLGLKVGDVLRLNSVPEAPLPLQVHGMTKMLGMPVIHHGNLALDITEVR